MNSKKLFSIFAIALFISALFSSCRSRDACPGVSKLEQNQSTEVTG